MRRLLGRVPEHPTDLGETEPGAEPHRRDPAAEVVQARSLQPRPAAHLAPRLLEIDAVRAGLGAREDVGVVLRSRKPGEQGDGGLAQRHASRAGLAVGQGQDAALEIEVLPPSAGPVAEPAKVLLMKLILSVVWFV